MEVTVSRISPVEVEMKVTLPKERVTSALSKAFNELGREAQIKGFRKGKAPVQVLRQLFGPKVAEQVSGQLIEETFNVALEGQKLSPVVDPQVRIAEPLKDNTAWEYTARMEVRPEVGEVALEGIVLERPPVAVKDEDVQKLLEEERERFASLRVPEPMRPVQATDSATIDYDIKVDGEVKPELAQKSRTVEVGRGSLIKEIDEGLLGMNVGETKELTVQFSDKHAREELRGKTGIVNVTLRELREKVLPTLDDEFAKDAGKESLEAFRKELRDRLEKEAKEESEAKIREDLILELAKKNPIAVPPSLVKNAAVLLAREVAQASRLAGAAFDAEEIVKTAQEQAEQRVRAGLLLAEVAQRNGLTVTEADLNARLEQMAAETGRHVARLRVEYRDAKKREGLANAVLEDKVIALVLEKVTVKDAAPAAG